MAQGALNAVTAPFDWDGFRRAVEQIRAMPTAPPAEVTGVDYPAACTREELRDVILTAEYWRADLAIHPATVELLRQLAEEPLYTRPIAFPIVPLGPRVIVDADVPPYVIRLRARNPEDP